MHGSKLIVAGAAAIVGIVLLWGVGVAPWQVIAGLVLGGMLIWLGVRALSSPVAVIGADETDTPPFGNERHECQFGHKREPTAIRVVNHGGFGLWFVFAVLLFALSAIIGQHAPARAAVIGASVVASLGILAILYGLFGAIRWVEFGDHVAVRCLLRTRFFAWSEIDLVAFEDHEGRQVALTGLGVIPQGQYTVAIRLKRRPPIRAHIDRKLIPAVSAIVDEEANLDWSAEEQRLESEARFEIRFNLLMRTALGVFFLGLGTVVAIRMGEEIVYGTWSRWWPTARGTIVASALGSEESKSRWGSSTFYFLIVKYRYTVEGQTHVGDRYRYCPEKTQDKSEAESRLRHMRPGAQVFVHFKPNTPSTSVLIPGIRPSRYVLSTVCVVAAVAGLLFAMYNLRVYRSYARQWRQTRATEQVTPIELHDDRRRVQD